MDQDTKKKHSTSKSGAKINKKPKLEDVKKHSNIKGFSIQHTTKAARKVRKTLDHELKKYHLPTNAAAVEAAPPLIAGIVGPPASGKSTLLRSLIRHFGRQLVPVVTGPITVIVQSSASMEEHTGKKLKRRLTEGERRIYAPMSNIGGVLFDRDATYIDLGGSHHLGGGRLTSGRQVVQGATESELTKARLLLSEQGSALDERLSRDHEVRMTADAPLLLGSHSGTGVVEVSDSVHDNTEDSDSDSENSVVSAASPDEEASSDFESRSRAAGEESYGVRMFEDMTFPDSERANDEGPNFGLPGRPAKFDRRHRDIKNAFDALDWQETVSTRINWKQHIYSPADESTANVDDGDVSVIAGGMFKLSTTTEPSKGLDDVTLPFGSEAKTKSSSALPDWSKQSTHSLIVNKFTTGEWNASEDAEKLLEADENARHQLQKLKSTKLAKAAGSRVQYRPQRKSEPHEESEEEDGLSSILGSEDDEEQENSSEEVEDEVKNADPTAEFEKSLLRPTKRQKLLEKRQRHKELFDKLYDAAQRGTATGDEKPTAFYDKIMDKLESQRNLNKEVLGSLPPNVREEIEGAAPGAYVRLEISGVPCQFAENFDARQPLVIGSVAKGEEAMSFIHARFQNHRWLKRVLKSNDPITVSLGWRRYQTVAVFSKEEHNLRNRYLKYSLEHEHCHITFRGPVVPAKTGLVAFVNSAWRDQIDNKPGAPSFRIAGTGTVTDCNESFQIMKKLKLVGHPFKIFSKTAFIRGMFNSELEVSKMVGSKVQTVSKIRGLVKSALTNSSSFMPGDFRATFEAPIRMADIVFLRSFVPIEIPSFYNPVLNLLMPQAGTATNNGQKQWRMLRTHGELRQAAGAKPEVREDSQYKPIIRQPFVADPLTVPTKLVAALPFADQPKPTKRQLRTIRFSHDEVRKARLAGVPKPVDLEAVNGAVEVPDPVGQARKRAELLQRLRALHSVFLERKHDKMASRISGFRAKRAAEEAQLEARRKRTRKQFFARHHGHSAKASKR
ncbi:Glycoside hydrolase 2 (Mannanase, beta-galactosidase) [Sparganum proliferum]